jgi:hypothetical protein
MSYLPGHTYDFKVLLRVYVTLLVLAGGMVVLSLLPVQKIPVEWIDLHVLRGLLIFGLALVMTAVVAGFLMGLKYEKSKLNTVVFLGNFAFLALFVAFLWADIQFRGLLAPDAEKQINWESPVLKVDE